MRILSAFCEFDLRFNFQSVSARIKTKSSNYLDILRNPCPNPRVHTEEPILKHVESNQISFNLKNSG